MPPKVQTIQEIMAELNPAYQTRKDFINQQITAVPQQLQADEQILEGQRQKVFGDITQQASDRGMFFSGIPASEQAMYTGTNYLPALTKLRQGAQTQQGTLRQTLSDIDADIYKTAFGVNKDQSNRAQDYQERLRQEQLAREKESRDNELAIRLAGIRSAGSTAAPEPEYSRRADGGFNFKAPDGRSISAAQYAQMTGQPIQNVLADMAAQGDAYAKQVLNAMVNDPGYAANPTGFMNYYRPIFWGTYETS